MSEIALYLPMERIRIAGFVHGLDQLIDPCKQNQCFQPELEMTAEQLAD